jgi:hypothetical protein
MLKLGPLGHKQLEIGDTITDIVTKDTQWGPVRGYLVNRPEKTDQLFVVKSVYINDDGTRIVHAWGPYIERRLAVNARLKMIRRAKRRDYMDEANAYESGKLTFHTGIVTDPFEVRELIDGEWVVVAHE